MSFPSVSPRSIRCRQGNEEKDIMEEVFRSLDLELPPGTQTPDSERWHKFIQHRHVIVTLGCKSICIYTLYTYVNVNLLSIFILFSAYSTLSCVMLLCSFGSRHADPQLGVIWIHLACPQQAHIAPGPAFIASSATLRMCDWSNLRTRSFWIKRV